MELYIGILVFLAIIAMVTLFIISTSLTSMSRNIRIMRKLLTDWKKESGAGLLFTCHKCHNKYEGKQPVCPHCGTAIPQKQ
jgi:hypothetical protein